MLKKVTHKKGFTIIELLVVIVVIGILVTIMVISYNGIQQRSRDSRRGSDITQIKIALEKYHAAKSAYPDACSVDTGCNLSTLATQLAPYLTTIPHDPKYTANTYQDYQYVMGPLTGDSYGLYVRYEAKAECKDGTNINTNWWTPAVPQC
jgi:prepilin-type N-terminal cleavage/methylation domain-containing protein